MEPVSVSRSIVILHDGRRVEGAALVLLRRQHAVLLDLSRTRSRDEDVQDA